MQYIVLRTAPMSYFAPIKCPRCNENKTSWDLKGSWFIKKGYFKTKHNSRHVPRYLCKRCKHTFCSRSHSPNYKQKKPHLNALILKWYASGATQRRIALNLGINRKTVVRKFLYLARQSRRLHEQRLSDGLMKVKNIQFDEMETYEHTIFKPLSIAIAVDAESGEIIDACAAEISRISIAKSKWVWKYLPRPDNREIAQEDVFLSIQKTKVPGTTITTDSFSSYPSLVAKYLPDCNHTMVLGSKRNIVKKEGVRRNQNDNLWRVNHTIAKLRHDLVRLGRKTWATTKRMWALQAHLDLYIAYNNGYKLV